MICWKLLKTNTKVMMIMFNKYKILVIGIIVFAVGLSMETTALIIGEKTSSCPNYHREEFRETIGFNLR